MNIYQLNNSSKIAIVESINAAGMCSKTIGMTLVVFNYEDENLEYPLIMENREFHKIHTIK